MRVLALVLAVLVNLGLLAQMGFWALKHGFDTDMWPFLVGISVSALALIALYFLPPQPSEERELRRKVRVAKLRQELRQLEAGQSHSYRPLGGSSDDGPAGSQPGRKE